MVTFICILVIVLVCWGSLLLWWNEVVRERSTGRRNQSLRQPQITVEDYRIEGEEEAERRLRRNARQRERRAAQRQQREAAEAARLQKRQAQKPPTITAPEAPTPSRIDRLLEDED